MWQKAKNLYHLSCSLAANLSYGFPGRKLTVIGVTGTSGKTTTTLMIYEVLKAAGYKVSVLSTIKAVIGGKDYDTGFHVTTPDPHILPKYLKQAIKRGDTHFVLEVSSHALDQNRAAFVPFEIGVLTSFAHEHLDYHKTLENYARAKFKLLHSAKTAILPEDVLDENLKEAVNFNALKGKMKTFGLKKGDQTNSNWQFSLELPGDFNRLNALATATVGLELDIDKKIIKRALENFTGIPGRVEEIQNNRGLHILIDFAHKPDALEAILQVGREIVSGTKGRIIVMYGCASERDILKRPIMGEISGKGADTTVITDEDPRFEDPMKIINEIAEGCIKAGAKEMQRSIFYSSSEERSDESRSSRQARTIDSHVFYKIPDRAEAIDFIVNTLAKEDDVILLCGKGHEQSMNYKGIEKPWSEHKAVQRALQSNKNESK